MGYDKSDQLSPEWFKGEYLKVEPLLNVLSTPVKNEKLQKLSEVERQNEELQTRVKALEEQLTQRAKGDQVMNRLVEDPEFLALLARKVKELGLKA